VPDRRIVSLTATGPDGIVVEVQLAGRPTALLTRSSAASTPPWGTPLRSSRAGSRSRWRCATSGCRGGWLGEVGVESGSGKARNERQQAKPPGGGCYRM
jgi:hypothetical protein